MTTTHRPIRIQRPTPPAPPPPACPIGELIDTDEAAGVAVPLPVRYVLQVCKGQPEGARPVCASLLWRVLGSPSTSPSNWLRGLQIPPPPVGKRLVLSWREAFELAAATETEAGRRTHEALNHPEKGPHIVTQLLDTSPF